MLDGSTCMQLIGGVKTGMPAADGCSLLHLQDELAANVTLEQGKTLPDARGDVFRGLGECPAVLVIHMHACMHAQTTTLVQGT